MKLIKVMLVTNVLNIRHLLSVPFYTDIGKYAVELSEHIHNMSGP